MKATVITLLLLIALAVGFASHQASTPSLYAPPIGSSVTAPAHGKAAKMLKVHLPVHMLGSLLRAGNGQNNGNNNQDQGQ